MAGPIPERTEFLAEPRKAERGEVTKGTLRPVNIPTGDPGWHPVAMRVWDAMKNSGQADFYQESDWAFAYSLMDDLSYYKNSGKRSGQMLQSIYSAMERLLLTEADRRRARIELSEPEDKGEAASVTAINNARAALNLVK